jgi:hypothetical protein
VLALPATQLSLVLRAHGPGLLASAAMTTQRRRVGAVAAPIVLLVALAGTYAITDATTRAATQNATPKGVRSSAWPPECWPRGFPSRASRRDSGAGTSSCRRSSSDASSPGQPPLGLVGSLAAARVALRSRPNIAPDRQRPTWGWCSSPSLSVAGMAGEPARRQPRFTTIARSGLRAVTHPRHRTRKAAR